MTFIEVVAGTVFSHIVFWFGWASRRYRWSVLGGAIAIYIVLSASFGSRLIGALAAFPFTLLLLTAQGEPHDRW